MDTSGIYLQVVVDLLPRRFALVRHVDYTGISGVGVVAYGVVFGDGHVALRWPSEHPATSLWNSLDDLQAVHGHGEATSVEWLDPQTELLSELAEPTTDTSLGRRARRTVAEPPPPPSDSSEDDHMAVRSERLSPVSALPKLVGGHTGPDEVRVPPQRRTGRHRRAPVDEPTRTTQPIESDQLP